DKTALANAEALLSTIATGASVEVEGELRPSPAAGQKWELSARALVLLGPADVETYPLQKKKHSLEFLREIAHLRARTNTFGAVARVRNTLSFAIHEYFQGLGFYNVQTPIVTASDAEGAGQMFQVTTLDLDKIPKVKEGPSSGQVDYEKDFFGKKAHLTVSGQLNGETYATALGGIYTFGPTFRAENSNTTRHLAEFWMVEPEVSFLDIHGNMDLAEDFLKFVFARVLEKNPDEMAFFDQWVLKGVIDTLKTVIAKPFARITYTEAVDQLVKSGQKFEFPVSWGIDLQSEHERYLTDVVYQGPVIVTGYPKEIKAFYMKLNDDGKTVRAMDVLVPRLGEIIGGSQREEDLAKLEKRITDLGMDVKDYRWYLDLRRYGTVVHSGFGLGFERLVQYVTGMGNIRDVIPFPRTVGNAEF
ncbi:MAG TPA: asparagine--tRNA ligase, partial [Spirochaetia bacterium]|nr:asparagine--tRNA ligase [Spirochaetia bacterium]